MSASVTAERRVERLHLTATTETLRHRALRLLEDAFRTATLPDEAARLIVVRRLALPRFAAGISPQSLAMALEKAFAALARNALHASDRAAADAPAVWFRDAAEAHTLIALRLLDGGQAREWFWAHALPRSCVDGDAAERVRQVVIALAARDEAPAALCAFVAGIAAHARVDALLRVLHDADGAALLAAARVDVRGARPEKERAHTDAASLCDETAAASADARRTMRDPRRRHAEMLRGPAARFVAAMLARAGLDEAAIAAHIGERGRMRREPAFKEEAKRSTAPAAANDAPLARGARSPDLAPAPRPPRVPPAPASHAEKTPRRARGSARSDPAAIDPSPRASDPYAWIDGAPTAAGGLMFLLPVLARLGYAARTAALSHDASCALTAEVLAQALLRTRIAPEDAAHALVAAVTPPACALSRAERDRAAVWLAGCRGWLERRARLRLSSLVVRPARVRWSATHVDVAFDLAYADVRVRRVGLDIDPGWVPWLARVVSFRYAREGDLA